MADSSIDITLGSGTSVDTRTEATNGNHRQVVVIGDPATNAGVAPVDATNGLAVDVKASVIATGAATSAKQDTGNTSVGNIDTNAGATTDAAVATGAAGSISAKLRRISTDIGEINTNIPVQGQALGAIKNLMVAGSVTTNAPSYTTGQISPLSLTPAGGIRIDWKDSAANTTALNVSLAAETTKVIGVVRNSDGAGNLLTSNSTTYTAKFGLDSNLLGTKGTAFTTAGFVDIKGADGDVFVRQATGTNLHMVVDSGTITTVSTVTNVATIGTSVTPGTAAANLGKAEDVASAGGDTGVFTLGIRNDTLADTTNTTGDYSQMSTDLKGRLMVGSAPRTLKANQITTITTSTSETTIVTAVASTFLDLYGLILTNTSATAVNVAIKDDTGGTTRMNIAVPAGDTRGFMLPIDAAIKQSATNKNWTATSSGSITSLIITALTVANV